jgi:hypothetical protein
VSLILDSLSALVVPCVFGRDVRVEKGAGYAYFTARVTVVYTLSQVSVWRIKCDVVALCGGCGAFCVRVLAHQVRSAVVCN